MKEIIYLLLVSIALTNGELFENSIDDLDDPVVDVLQGQVQGRWDISEKGKSFKSFQGIPYGKVEKRFSAAIEADAFEESVFIAKTEGPLCPQLQSGYYPLPGNISEDCLSINVFVPEVARNLPVMVWIHGGGNIRGSGGDYYYGPQFLIDYEVILVTLNYRLGVFGFLSLENEEAQGNIALRDQLLAFDWVNRNIEFFGGDTSRITMFGESAGSQDATLHLVSPLSSGLFTAAIAQSGTAFGSRPRPKGPGHAKHIASDLARSFGCEVYDDDEILSCLREKSMDELLQQNPFCDEEGEYICVSSPWNAVVDAEFSSNPFLPDFPEKMIKNDNFNKVPLIIGINSEEGIYSAAKYIKDNSKFDEINLYWDVLGPLFIFDKAVNISSVEKEVTSLVRSFYLGNNNASMDNIHDVIDMFSDIIFWAGVHQYVSLAFPLQVEPIFHYMLTYKATNSFADLALGLDSEGLGLGVCHADDIYHLFKNHLYDLTFSEDDLLMREKMLTWWTNFAKVHVPDEDLWQEIWEGQGYLNISIEPHMEYSKRYEERMHFWMQMLEKLDQ